METIFSLLTVFTIAVFVPFSEANVTCAVNGISYICKNITTKDEFPLSLPANIRHVTLIGTDTLDKNFPNGLFRNPTWANVSELSIVEFSKIDFIEEEFLDGLEKLKYLSISSCPDLGRLHPNVFHSTPDLEALHLDWNPYLKLAIVEKALNGKLEKLKYLSLIGIQSFYRNVILGENFAMALRTKNVTYFDISRVNVLVVEHETVVEMISKIRYLNVSYTTILSTVPVTDVVPLLFQNIELLDLTGCVSMLQFDTTLNDTIVRWDRDLNIVYVFAENTIDPHYPARLNIRYKIEKKALKDLNTLDLSNNNIIILNITFSGSYDFQGLVTLKLSSNNMEYISPSFLSSFPSLKILDLSKNQLHKMQHLDDFSCVVTNNEDLETIFLPNNKLSVVPFNLFSSNTKLRLIDLSDNELTYFNLELSKTLDLKLIDLRKNRLKSLPVSFLGQLEQVFLHQDSAENHVNSQTTNSLISECQDRSLVGEKYKYGYNASNTIKLLKIPQFVPQYVTLNLVENALVCECDTLEFLQWIAFTDISILNRTYMVCKYDKKEELLTNSFIEMVRYNCRVAHNIVIGILSSFAVVLSIFTFGITIHYRRKKARENKDLENLEKEVLHDNTKFNFVVFLSYCSQDSLVVEENILPTLNTYLRKTFNTEKNLVCTGSDSFVPGMLIIEEIHRCINESLVIVPVITPAFLASRWSLRECVDAIERHRQVVVLMEQHTDTSGTIATIKHLIGQYTRASWSYNDGNFAIHPSWSTICDGIIQTACYSFRNHKNQRGNDKFELVRLVE
ncbi:hypothetical protein ACJMK2_000787 [Sinanodonta woodiana]|uniref:TIR domain-containing protein n=1 Tax=Sinanodonta woodiana TaxID=1069815 RepID=A0ABD3XS32_SINWO